LEAAEIAGLGIRQQYRAKARERGDFSMIDTFRLAFQVRDSRKFLRGCRKIFPSKRYTLSRGQFINATEVIARGEILVRVSQR